MKSTNMKTLKMVSSIAQEYDFDKAKLMLKLKELVKEGKKNQDLFLVGVSYYYLAYSCNEISDRDGLLTNALKAVALLKDGSEHELIVKAYMVLGYAYFEKVEFQKALECYDEAYKITKKYRIIGDTRISVLNNLSTAYHAFGDSQRSIKILKECISQLMIYNPTDYTSLAMYTLNLAENTKDIGKEEESHEILTKMGEWVSKVEFKPVVCDYYLRYAISFYLLKNSDEGGKYLDIALSLLPKEYYPHPIYEDLNKISHLLVGSNDKKRSKTIMDLMQIYSKKNKGTLEQIFAYNTMANYHHYFGDKDKALECYEILDDLYIKRIRELEVNQLGVHKKMRNADLEVQRLKKKIQKNDEFYSLEPLTKLLNRSALLKVSSEFIASSIKQKKKVGAVFIDIDLFKECNDTYGHAKGDEIIKIVADACRCEEKANIKFARYGGDEFFGITKGLSDDEVCDVARRICQKIKELAIPNEKNPIGQIITLSIGVVNVSVTDYTDTIIEIANYADKALYHAKSHGKNAIYMLKYNSNSDDSQYSKYIKIDF